MLNRLDDVPDLSFQAEKPTHGEKSSVGDHAVVRPYCLAFDMPTTVQNFDRAEVNPLPVQGFTDL